MKVAASFQARPTATAIFRRFHLRARRRFEGSAPLARLRQPRAGLNVRLVVVAGLLGLLLGRQEGILRRIRE